MQTNDQCNQKPQAFHSNRISAVTYCVSRDSHHFTPRTKCCVAWHCFIVIYVAIFMNGWMRNWWLMWNWLFHKFFYFERNLSLRHDDVDNKHSNQNVLCQSSILFLVFSQVQLYNKLLESLELHLCIVLQKYCNPSSSQIFFSHMLPLAVIVVFNRSEG